MSDVITPGDVRIISVERLNDGLVVQFADGRCVYYSAAVLRTMMAMGEEQDETTASW